MTEPYSLDVVSAQLTFTEVLVADHDGKSLTPSTRAYKFAVGPSFLVTHPDDTAPALALATVFGDCTPPGGPSMMRHAGATALTDTFFLRDLPDLGQHRGLAADGFALSYGDCNRGGSLDGEQGMIFVR